jgi:2-iminoacetate synthase ThiH
MLQCVRPLQLRPIKSRPESLTVPTAALPHDEIERWARRPARTHGESRTAARYRPRQHRLVLRKVFIPLTRLCRDTCRYCTFVRGPRGAHIRLSLTEEVLAIARAGVACRLP